MKKIFPAILCLFCFTLFILPLQAQQQKKKNARVKLAPVYIDLSQSRQTIEESKPEKVIIDRSNVTILAKAPQKEVPYSFLCTIFCIILPLIFNFELWIWNVLFIFALLWRTEALF